MAEATSLSTVTPSKEEYHSLEEGERIEFDLVMGAGGLNAANVIRVEGQN